MKYRIHAKGTKYKIERKKSFLSSWQTFDSLKEWGSIAWSKNHPYIFNSYKEVEEIIADIHGWIFLIEKKF